MKIAIIGAMDIEIDQILLLVQNSKKYTFCQTFFCEGQYKNTDLVVAKCGPGKVNAAICAQTIILKNSPDQILNIGIAGATSEMEIGEVVIAKEFVQYDVDTSALGDPVGMISGINRIKIPASQNILNALEKATLQTKIQPKKATFATGDKFTSREEIAKIQKQFGANVVEMEGAAIAQACYKASVDFGAIRIVSDNGNAQSGYEKFKVQTANKLSKIIEQHLELLNQ